jgi:hypothetical protein
MGYNKNTDISPKNALFSGIWPARYDIIRESLKETKVFRISADDNE